MLQSWAECVPKWQSTEVSVPSVFLLIAMHVLANFVQNVHEYFREKPFSLQSALEQEMLSRTHHQQRFLNVSYLVVESNSKHPEASLGFQ